MPLKTTVKEITPDNATMYLVGPEGTVWVQPGIGDAHIIAARSDAEIATAERFIAELLEMGLVPYGMPLDQRVARAMFGGKATRDCRWVKHTDAPAPTGEPGDPLPTRACVIV